MAQPRDPERPDDELGVERRDGPPGSRAATPRMARDSPDSDLFHPGDLVAGRYRVVRLIGYGGMGAVYEAEDTELGELVAVKALLPEVAAKATNLDRFLREISLARKVTHPNVCRIYDVGHHHDGDGGEEVTFLTMELLHGVTLSERLASGPLPTEEAIPIACQIAAGLSAAHDAGVVHRDFKSSNIILMATSTGPRAVITDFGLSCALAPKDREALRLTGTGQLLGTPAYFAPEQLEGGELTSATDIYALGVVIYEMVTGTLPFTADTSFLTALKRLREEPTDPLQHVPDLDRRWLEVIDGCLERQPKKRFAQARDILGVLGPEYLSEIATSMISRSVIAHRRRVRARVRWSIAAAVAVLVLGGAAFHSLRPGGRRPPAEPHYVAILPPELPREADAGAFGFIASDLEVALINGLNAREGIKVLVPLRQAPADSDPVEIARMLAADELLHAEVAKNAGHWQIALRRIGAADGTSGNAVGFRVPFGDDRLLADAVAVHLGQVFGDGYPLRPGKETLQVGSGDYSAYLRLRRTVESPPADQAWDAVLAELSALRASSPLFLETYLLEVRLANYSYATSRDTGYLDRANQLIDFARKITENDPRLFLREFEVALTADDLERAEAALSSLERLVPGDAELLAKQAQLAELRGAREEAVELMRRAAEIRPAWDTLYDLAGMELRFGRPEEARGHLERLLELSRSNYYGLDKLAELELAKGSVETAEEIYVRLVERSPEQAPLSNLGTARLFLGRFEEAAETFRRACELYPESPDVLFNCAESEQMAGREEEAFALYRKALRLLEADEGYPEWLRAILEAQISAHLGRTQEALAAIDRALRLDADNALVRYAAALVYTLIGERSSARMHAAAALDLDLPGRWFSLPWFDPLRSDPELARRLAEPPA